MLFYQSQICIVAVFICMRISSNSSVAQLIILPEMELEWGLKLTRVADEFSSADFQFAKDRTGPVFLSTETDTFFILNAHLKGYRKQNITIEINEDGTRIIIRCEKAIQETVMVGWKLYKKETEMRRFRKAFRIPDGVNLDKIKARFNEDESILTISMPKKEKGICGFSIEEVMEQEIARDGSQTLQIAPDEVPQEGKMLQDQSKETKAKYTEEAFSEDEESTEMPESSSVKEPKEAGLNIANAEETQSAEVHDMKEQKKNENRLGHDEWQQKVSEEHENVETDITEETKDFPDEMSRETSAKAPVVESQNSTNETPKVESGMAGRELENKEISQDFQGNMEREDDQPGCLKQETARDQHENGQVHEKGNEIQEEEEKSAVVKPFEEAQEGKLTSTEEEKGSCKLCTPILAGSAILLSLVVFVIHFIRSKSQPGKRKE